MSAVTAHEALERRLAARALLVSPIMTPAEHAEELALVRRHAKALREMFYSRFGYVLTVETGFARLQKHPLAETAVSRPARRSTGQPFTPRTYTYLALLCSALLSRNTGEQTLLTGLVEQVKADAVTGGITTVDSAAHARDLVQALYLLVGWGVISETEGTVAGWNARHEEVLLDVNRPLLPLLLAHPLRDAAAPADLLYAGPGRPGVPEEPRRSLRRKLAESPVVLRADMTEAERDVLSRERRALEDVFADDFGLVLEVRAEGALVYDPTGEVTDVAFPGRGTVPHAALLLTNALLDVLDPQRPAQESHSEPDDGAPDGRPPLPGKLAPWPVVDENVALLVEQYGSSFGAAYVADRALLREAVIDLLVSVELARPTTAGLVLTPACARYRPEPQRAPAHSRAVRRLQPAGLHDMLPLDPATDPVPEDL